MAKIYVASSWRNEFQPMVVTALRFNKHDVYDFRHEGFSWSSIDENWKDWDNFQYKRILNHPLAIKGYKRDIDALKLV